MVSGTLGGHGVGVQSHVMAVGSDEYGCAKAWLSQGNSVRAMERRSTNAVSSVAQVTL